MPPTVTNALTVGEGGRAVHPIKWLRRHRDGGQAALANRSSRPHSSGAAHTGHWSDVAAHLRREYRLTGAEIAERLRLARSTVSRWLTRAGIGRLARLDPIEPARRHQRERPRELIPLDIKKLGRFSRIGHRITGDRTRQSTPRQSNSRLSNTHGVCWDFVHVAIDDATRLA